MPLIKHFVLIFVLSFALGGCKTFKKLGEIETAVKNLTHHDSVNVSIHTSTSDDTGITVTLYNYHVERFTITELKNEATSIDSTIKKVNPEWGNLKSRIIRYTSSANPDENDSVISFKFPLQDSN